MKLGDALVEMFLRHPFLRVALWAMLICWVIAGLAWLVSL